MSSSVLNASAALRDALRAAAALSGVTVVDIGEVREADAFESIEIWPVEKLSREWGPLRGGVPKFDESYVIPLEILVIEYGEDLDSVRARLWQVVTAIEQTVLADRAKLGGAVDACMPVGADGPEQVGVFGPAQVAAKIRLQIHCEARVDLLA